MSHEKLDLFEAIEQRRSIRRLKRDVTLGRGEIEDILKKAMFAPSALNMQSTRLMVLEGFNHQKIWDIVDETLTAKIGEERMGAIRERLQGFRNGNGTILFLKKRIC